MHCAICNHHFSWGVAPVKGLGVDWKLSKKEVLFGEKKKKNTMSSPIPIGIQCPLNLREEKHITNF